MTTNYNTQENNMRTLTLENAKNWEYITREDLSVMDNLKVAHNEYESIQNSCKEALVYTSIKIGKIYKDAKVEMYTGGNKITNHEIGNQFAVSEATVRNYIRIYDNKEIVMATFKPEELNISGMLAIINGKSIQNEDGSLSKEHKPKIKADYIVQNEQLKKENNNLKAENEQLQKELEKANSKITEMSKGN